MPLLRLPLAALLSAALLCVTASVAAADPPWSVPIPVPGVGNGAAAATARGHVAALTISNRNQAPSTASQLVRLNPADGAVLSSTGIDLADAAITPYATDAIAVAGSSIGPSGTVDDQSRVRAGTTSAAIDPQTRRPIALFTDFTASQPLVSVRPPAAP
jgi:hypothetical protein